jgi:acyl carrier protein
MQPFQRIMVPVEGVRDSLGPIEHATQLARHFDAEVLLVHVDDALPGRAIDETERRSAARRDLDALRGDLKRVRDNLGSVDLNPAGKRMDVADVKNHVLRILAGIAPEADLDRLGEDQELREWLDLDSMDLLNFVTALDQQLHVGVPESDYAALETLKGCLDYLAPRAS